MTNRRALTLALVSVGCAADPDRASDLEKADHEQGFFAAVDACRVAWTATRVTTRAQATARDRTIFAWIGAALQLIEEAEGVALR